MNTTTTNQTRNSISPTFGRSAGRGWIWKSAVVTASLTSVLLGWAALSNGDGSVETATTAPASQTLIVNSNGQTSQRLVMPQKPLFQQPVTRTRRS